MFRAVLLTLSFLHFISIAHASERDLILGKLSAEPSVKSASWRSMNEIALARDGNGSRQDGFATYACGVVTDVELQPVPPAEFIMVSVFDANFWPKVERKLGWAVCPKSTKGQNDLIDAAFMIDGVTGLGVKPDIISADVSPEVDPKQVAATICDLVLAKGFNAPNIVQIEVRGRETSKRDCR